MMSEQEQKAIIKEAIKEWMDERLAQAGKWVLQRIAIAAFGFGMYIVYSKFYKP